MASALRPPEATTTFRKMRTLLVLLALLLATAILAPIVAIARLLGVKEKPGSIYERCMHAWARTAIRAAGVKGKVHGRDNLPVDAGVVYIANHVSWFDVLALAAELPRYTFVAKTELRDI